MPKFNVSVEKRLYCTGTVTISAVDCDAAITQVRTRINAGQLQTTGVEWDDPQYEDDSFDVTGDVDEI